MSTGILICDSVADETIQMLKKAGFKVAIKTELTPGKLEEIPNYQAMVVRSATKIRKNIIDKATNLRVIVRAGVGLDISMWNMLKAKASRHREEWEGKPLKSS